MLDRHLIVKTFPLANEENIVLWKNYRVTVLSDRLFRIEYSPNRKFRDDATQCVWYRNMPKQQFSFTETATEAELDTGKCILILNENESLCRVKIGNKCRQITERGNLLGTSRTLDQCDGDRYYYNLSNKDKVSFRELRLDSGICSKTGVAYFDDAASLTLGEDGEVKAERGDGSDRYVFAFGDDYRGAVKALYMITGSVPLVPRFALGNWWSRYYPYTQAEYLKLLQRFEDHRVPLTVATIDMDWHWSKTLDKEKRITESGRNTEFYGGNDGWTGYSWNTKLFPDYRSMLREIQRRHLKITLNLHPAGGVRWFEDMYPAFAKALGADPKTGEKIPFNMADPAFINAYFKILHKPYEKDGVDFWWIDWQQGTESKMTGLDPLWSLNHYHYLDNGKNHPNPLILSRYAGIGSHRYPLGFSGDTYMTWRTLRYLPYFTFTASNIGYCWWSHDIGGHMLGETSGELYVRHVQFGVFSPINRLHSTVDSSLTKEPWAYMNGRGEVLAQWLRFRHSLIPFLYSCSMRTHREGLALIEPLYYEWKQPRAYSEKYGYIFGGQTVVYPIVTPADADGYARSKVWLPEGRWTDIFTGDEYRIAKGGECRTLVRNLESIPVLAREGAILPLSLDEGNSIANPHKLEIRVYNGNGSFELYEDNREDGGTEEFSTRFTVCAEGAKQMVTIVGEGDWHVVPEDRVLRIRFANIRDGKITVTRDGVKLDVEPMYEDDLSVEIPFDALSKYAISVNPLYVSDIDRLKNHAKKILLSVESDYLNKQTAYWSIDKVKTEEEYREAVAAFPFSDVIKARFLETIG